MIETVLIPRERKAILIGRNGFVKRKIERVTNTRITINEDVEIEGDMFNVMKARDVITAIARGFSPMRAFVLLSKGYELKVISLIGQNEKTIKRLMARVIGRKGTTRRIIEYESNTNVSVYGKTVSIIGTPESIAIAQEAVEALLAGRKHGSAYIKMKRKKESND